MCHHADNRGGWPRLHIGRQAPSIAMLDLEKVCARPSLGCAARIIDAQGTVREATRLVAASDVLYWASRRGEAAQPALARSIEYTYRFLTAASLRGGRGALYARPQLGLRFHNASPAGLLYQ